MVSLDDVARIALALPGVEEGSTYGSRSWKLRGRLVVWERPLRRRDLDELGDAAPAGTVLGAAVEGEDEKRALVQSEPEAFFTTHHFDGHPTVLVRLESIDEPRLAELVETAWLVRGGRR